jgi:hypothetical protein
LQHTKPTALRQSQYRQQAAQCAQSTDQPCQAQATQTRWECYALTCHTCIRTFSMHRQAFMFSIFKQMTHRSLIRMLRTLLQHCSKQALKINASCSSNQWCTQAPASQAAGQNQRSVTANTYTRNSSQAQAASDKSAVAEPSSTHTQWNKFC